MKHLLLIATMLLTGCMTTHSPAKAPDISINQAILDGDIKVIKQHLAAGTDVNSKDAGGWTPLHWAAGEGYKKAIKLLLSNGANINATEVTGRTPLDYAMTTPETRIAALLRKYGAKTAKELRAEKGGK